MQWTARTTGMFAGVEVVVAYWADQEFFAHVPHPIAVSNWLSNPPTKKANGNIRATMASITRHPRDFAIMSKLATQGTNNVMVTIDTTT